MTGFGGVGLGLIAYAEPLVSMGEADDGKRDFNRTLSSEYFLRVRDTRTFVGFATAIQGGSAFQRTMAVWEQASAEGETACYADAGECYNSVTNSYTDVLHVPLEANTAYTWEKGRFIAYAGGGPSIHYFKMTGYFANSAYQLYDADPAAAGEPDNTTVVSQFGEYTAQNAKLKYGIGGQAFVGAAMELGKAPYIGGRWGIVASARYQYVKETKVSYKGQFEANEYNLDGTEFEEDIGGDLSEEFEGDMTLRAKSYGARVGLVFFM